MTIEDHIRDEKLQYHQAKLISMTILRSNQQQIIEEAKFTFSPLGKAFEKQTKIIEDQGKKQVNVLKSLKSLKPKEVNQKKQSQLDMVIIFLMDWLKYKNLWDQLILII